MRSLILLIALLIAATTPVAAEPAWPSTGDTLDLTWAVRHDSTARMSKGTVELVLAIGATERTVLLGDVYGGLSPLDQPMCGTAPRDAGAPPPMPLGKGEVAKLVFGGGIVRGYAVRRTKPTELAIVAFDMGDESCGKPDCPPKPITTIAIPARVKIREHIVLVDKAGKRTPFSCKID